MCGTACHVQLRPAINPVAPGYFRWFLFLAVSPVCHMDSVWISDGVRYVSGCMAPVAHGLERFLSASMREALEIEAGTTNNDALK